MLQCVHCQKIPFLLNFKFTLKYRTKLHCKLFQSLKWIQMVQLAIIFHWVSGSIMTAIGGSWNISLLITLFSSYTTSTLFFNLNKSIKLLILLAEKLEPMHSNVIQPKLTNTGHIPCTVTPTFLNSFFMGSQVTFLLSQVHFWKHISTSDIPAVPPLTHPTWDT